MFSFKNKLIIFLILIFLVGAISTFFVFINTKNSQIEKLTQRASTIAHSLNEEDIFQLQGNETDLESFKYHLIKDKFKNIKSTNEDITFVYLMGKKDGEYFFFLDSEDESSEDYSPPGQKYEDDATDLNYVFQSKQPISTSLSDSWGSWISSTAPIIYNDKIIAVLGIDVDKTIYNQTIFIYTLIPISITLILMIIILSLILISKAQNESLEIRSNFVSIAAHDLRSPLTAIKWICEIILKPGVTISDEEKTNYIKDIDKNTQILMTFVEELLNATSVKDKAHNKIIKESVNINEIINQAISPLELSIKEKNIELEIDKIELNIDIDKDKIRRVFSNFLSNSIKYSPENSKIEIEFEIERNNLITYIKDQGIGIPKSEQNKILNGYYRAKNAKQFTNHGTGLGLLYCINVIKAHKGKMRIESEENKGTEIIIELPIK